MSIYQYRPSSPAASNADWDSLTNKPTLYSPFCIWAEENGDLTTGNSGFQWSFGNGNVSPAGMGVVIPMDCELFAGSLSLEGAATCEIEIRRGDIAVVRFKIQNTRNGFTEFAAPIAYSAGDAVNFRTISGHSNSNGAIVAAWFRIRTL